MLQAFLKAKSYYLYLLNFAITELEILLGSLFMM